jgi:transcriptional regulator
MDLKRIDATEIYRWEWIWQRKYKYSNNNLLKVIYVTKKVYCFKFEYLKKQICQMNIKKTYIFYMEVLCTKCIILGLA